MKSAMPTLQSLKAIPAHWPRLFHAGVFLLSLILVQALWAEDSERKVVAKTAPSYPELARRMHAAGKVRVEAVVSPSGSVTAAKMVGGSPIFEKSALDAVRQWKFESGPKETKTIVVLEFGDQQ